MKADIVIGAGGIEGGLKRLKRISAEIQRDARKKRFFRSKSELRRIAKSRGITKWRKKRAAIARRIRGEP